MSQPTPATKKPEATTNTLISEEDNTFSEATDILKNELDIDSLEAWVKGLSDMDDLGQFDIR